MFPTVEPYNLAGLKLGRLVSTRVQIKVLAYLYIMDGGVVMCEVCGHI